MIVTGTNIFLATECIKKPKSSKRFFTNKTFQIRKRKKFETKTTSTTQISKHQKLFSSNPVSLNFRQTKNKKTERIFNVGKILLTMNI